MFMLLLWSMFVQCLGYICPTIDTFWIAIPTFPLEYIAIHSYHEYSKNIYFLNVDLKSSHDCSFIHEINIMLLYFMKEIEFDLAFSFAM